MLRNSSFHSKSTNNNSKTLSFLQNYFLKASSIVVDRIAVHNIFLERLLKPSATNGFLDQIGKGNQVICSFIIDDINRCVTNFTIL